MSVEIRLKNNAFHFEGQGENGAIINIDGTKKIGGEDKGPSPMELLLLGAASCSAIDVLTILRKQRQSIEGVLVYQSIIRAFRADKQVNLKILH